MTDDLFTAHDRPAERGAPTRRSPSSIDLATTIALVVLLAMVSIAVSIGIARADALGAVMDSDLGRLALIGLILVIGGVGASTAVLMWLTAPAPQRCRFEDPR
jgi:hypothetical protein